MEPAGPVAHVPIQPARSWWSSARPLELQTSATAIETRIDTRFILDLVMGPPRGRHDAARALMDSRSGERQTPAVIGEDARGWTWAPQSADRDEPVRCRMNGALDWTPRRGPSSRARPSSHGAARPGNGSGVPRRSTPEASPGRRPLPVQGMLGLVGAGVALRVATWRRGPAPRAAAAARR